jgi:chromosome segregation ATPase
MHLGQNWDGLDLAVLEADILRLEERRDIWKAEYDQVKAQMEILKEKSRGQNGEKGTSNPVIGAMGKHLQAINRGGYLRVQESLTILKAQAQARRALLDLQQETEELRTELEMLFEQDPQLKSMLDAPVFPKTKGFDSDSYVQQIQAQVSQLRKALRANEVQVKEINQLHRESLGKSRAMLGSYLTHLKQVGRGLKDQLDALDPLAKGLEHDTREAQAAMLAVRVYLEKARDTGALADDLVEESRQEAAAKTSWWKRFKIAEIV